MNPDPHQESFRVWATDHLVYGPVELATLVDWVQDGRVFAKTWVHVQSQDRWWPAEQIGPLQELFSNQATPHDRTASRSPTDHEVLAEELRQFPAFASLSNEQLEKFVRFGELVEAARGQLVLKRGDPSDSLFFVLSGQVRARLVVGYEDKTLGRILAGECLGEMAMFTHTPRSADVIAESDSRLLRLTSESWLLLINQLPQVAAPILFGMARMMALRIAERNQQYQKDVAAEFLWH